METKQDFEYVLISQNGLAEGENPLVVSLAESATYQLEYQEGDIAIFRKSH